MPAPIVPSACFWCDLPKRTHARQYYGLTGWHRYTPPTDRVILARMLARRAARTNTTGGTNA